MKNTMLLASTSLLALAVPIATYAQEEDEVSRMGTIVVTAQKTEESLQDVPIAVSAFDGELMERLNLNDGKDLQFAIPNLQIGKGNFTSGNISIRGIGSSAVGTTADGGVGVHMNDTPLTSSRFFQTEYYDMERVEVLRGPQGTLFGRNATGGVINAVSAKPKPGVFSGDAKLSFGNFAHKKAVGHVNVGLGDTAALRFAGFYLDQDGFTENLGTGNDVDDRNMLSYRASFLADLNDRTQFWAMFQQFEEDSTQMRMQKQFCNADRDRTFPFNQGCNTFATDTTNDLSGALALGVFDYQRDSNGRPIGAPRGSDTPNLSGAFLNLLATAAGLYPSPVVFDPAAGLSQPSDIRTINQPIDPSQKSRDNLVQMKLTHEFENGINVSVLGAYQTAEFTAYDDFTKFQTQPFIPQATGLGPISGGILTSGGGLLSPAVLGFDRINGIGTNLVTANSLVSTDRSYNDSDQWTGEIRFSSDFDGRFNFNAGLIYIDFETIAGYNVYSNAAATLSLATQSLFNTVAPSFAGLPPAFGAQVTNDTIAVPAATFGLLPPALAGLLTATPRTTGPLTGFHTMGFIPVNRSAFINRQGYRLNSTAFSGEVYYDLTDNLKLTGGLRVTSDDKEADDYLNALAQSTDAVPGTLVTGETITSTRQASFDETTGRIGVDWTPTLDFTDDTLVYAFYSKGYKGGGFNPPPSGAASVVRNTFDPEFVNAIEIGTKNTVLDGRAQVNASAFHYEYEGYQVSQIVEQTSVNVNTDATLWGLEFEIFSEPMDNLFVDFTMGYLNSELGNSRQIDPLNPTAGNPNFYVQRNIALQTSNCAVPVSAFTAPAFTTDPTVTGNPALFAATAAAAGTFSAGGNFCGNGNYGLDANNDGLIDLTEVVVGPDNPFGALPGIAQDLSGNELPGTPELTFSLGVQYDFDIPSFENWSGSVRGDYYYQTEAYTRLFNLDRDRIDSWDNANISLTFTNDNHGLFVEVFGKNILESEQLVGSFNADPSSGAYTNASYLEPALYGVTIGKSW